MTTRREVVQKRTFAKGFTPKFLSLSSFEHFNFHHRMNLLQERSRIDILDSKPREIHGPAVFHPVALSSFSALRSSLVFAGAIPCFHLQVSEFDTLARFERGKTSQHYCGCRAKQNGDLYPGHFGSVLP